MYVKSAIFYMGGKFDLLNELLPRFPKNEAVNSFIDLFGGGGAISLNSPYKKTLYNEINGNIVNLMQMLKDNEPETIINHIKNRIEEFDLNKEGTDIRQNVKGIEETRNKYSKNYFKFRDFYNKHLIDDYRELEDKRKKYLRLF
jgi:adenine-specific DNA-methyltransferase